MKVTFGYFGYLTKLHFLNLKFDYPSIYIRDHFDYLILDTPKGKVKITQDGLIYLRIKAKLEEIDSITEWFKEKIISKVIELDKSGSFFINSLKKEKLTIIIEEKRKDIQKIFAVLDRTFNYKIKSKHIEKNYGDGLVIYRKINLPQKKLESLIEHQIIFAEYQTLMKKLLEYSKIIYKKIQNLRKKEEFRYKEIPIVINNLLDLRREVFSLKSKISQLDDFIAHRDIKCNIHSLLDELKLNDFKEFIKLNRYMVDQYSNLEHNITSTLELTQFIYQENEQREINILQVIFAIGTIATIVSLGSMPGAKIFLSLTEGGAKGSITSFNFQSLAYWTFISVGIGIILFIVLNYVFLYAKKLRIIKLVKEIKKI